MKNRKSGRRPKIRRNAERFSTDRFQRKFKAFVDEKWAEFLTNSRVGQADA